MLKITQKRADIVNLISNGFNTHAKLSEQLSISKQAARGHCVRILESGNILEMELKYDGFNHIAFYEYTGAKFIVSVKKTRKPRIPRLRKNMKYKEIMLSYPLLDYFCFRGCKRA